MTKLQIINQIIKERKQLETKLDELEAKKDSTPRAQKEERKELRIEIANVKLAIIENSKKLPAAQKLLEEINLEQMEKAKVQPHEI